MQDNQDAISGGGPRPDWEAFGREVMECWPDGDVDGGHLQELAERHNIIVAVPGGFNPEVHGKGEFADWLEPGDPYFKRNYPRRGAQQ